MKKKRERERERRREGKRERKVQENIVPVTLQNAMLIRKQMSKILRFLG